MTTRSTRTPRLSRALANRSWVSGRSAVRPWSFIAIALASHGPIQIGRYRSWSVSFRMTTWRLDSMWTRTLSTTISTSPFRASCSSLAMAGLSHAELVDRSDGARRTPAVEPADEQPDDHAEDEPADVFEQGDASAGMAGPGGETAEQVEGDEAGPPEPILDVVAEDPQVEHVADQVDPAAVQEHARDDRDELVRQAIQVARREGRREVTRDERPVVEQALEGRVAHGRLRSELVAEGDHAEDDQPDRHDRKSPRRVGVAEGDHVPGDAFADGFGEPGGREPGTPEADGAGDPGVRPVPGVQDAGPLVGRRGDPGVGRRRPEERVAARCVARVARGLDVPSGARAPDIADDRATVGQEEVAVDQQVGDLRDVAIDGQPALGVDREATAVAGRGVVLDVLPRRIDEVQVVQAVRAVADERPDGRDVVAPAGGARDPDAGGRALALRIGGPPAEHDALVVDDDEVARAGRDQLRDAFDRSVARPRPLAEDDRRPLRPEIDAIDGRRRLVEDVRHPVGPEDHRLDIE